jgi:outer membrane lipoprotein-sorting protein
MRRAISAAALALLLLVPAAPYAQSVILVEVMASLASAKASRASFVETKTSSLLNAPLVMRGTLEYRRPDFLAKHIVAPRDERIVLSGGSLTVQSGSRTRKLEVSAAPLIGALVEGMLAVRAGNLASLEKHFGVDVSGQRQQWTLVLKPTGELAGYVSAITVSGLESRIVELDVLEPNGDRAVMRIREEVE